MFVYYKLYRVGNRFLLRSRHIGVEIRKQKTAVPGVEVVHEKARSVRPFFLFVFLERTSSFSAGQSSAQPQQARD